MVGKNTEYATTIAVDDDKDSESNSGLTVMPGGNGNGLEPAARSANALWKRAEQLKRWQDSETNRENPNPVRGAVAVSWSNTCGHRGKVKFSDECVFLAACASGDIDDVERLLEHGADINTTNVDGMTALHQAVIDQNLDIVQYLVENNADIDAQDHEGWTPLMAGVSCDFSDIVRYLLDKGADPSAVNSDGELPLDLTDSPEMRSILEQEISRRGISLEDARHQEEQAMMRDALELLNSRTISRDKEKRHPRTGATALHVAAAKGYIKVMNILIQAGADVNAMDFEGWTPLHAGAHWGERQACEILVEHLADMDIENHAKQTCFDVADSDELCQALEEMKKKQEQIKKERKPFESLVEQSVSSRQPQEYKVRKNSVTRISTDCKKNITKSDETKEAEALRTASSSEASDQEDEKKANMDEALTETPAEQQPTPTLVAASPSVITERKRQEVVRPTAGPPKLPKLDSKEIKPSTTVTAGTTSIVTTPAVSSPLASVSVTVVQPSRTRPVTSVASTIPSSAIVSKLSTSDLAKSGTKTEESKTLTPVTHSISKPTHGPPAIIPSEASVPPWRMTGRRGLHPSAIGEACNESGSNGIAPPIKATTPQPSTVVSVQVTSTATPTPSRVTVVGTAPAEAVNWRSSRFSKPGSFEEEKSSHKLPWVRSSNPSVMSPPPWANLVQKRLTGSVSSSPTNSSSPTVSPSFTHRNQVFSPPPMLQPTVVRPAATGHLVLPAANQLAKPSQWLSYPRHAISEPGTSLSSTSFRPFTPPQRSEESEAERKVRAKRERESRRSTQGVTLETVKIAEQMYGSAGSVSGTKEPVQETSEKGVQGDAKENKPPAESTRVQRPSTIDMDSSTKSHTTSSLYPWRTTGRISANNGTDVAKSDVPTQSADKIGSKSSTAPLMNRFQNCNQNDPDNGQEAAKDTSSTSAPSTTIATAAATSPSAAASATANIPNRKRLRNTRRSTGPVAQEDVQLALETDQEGQMTTDDDSGSGSVKETAAAHATAGAGDHKQQAASSKLSTGSTVIPIGGTEGASPVSDRKTFVSGSSSEQTNVSGHRQNNRYLFVKGDTVSSSTRTSTVNAASTNSAETDYKKLYEREKTENDRLLEKIKYLENLIESTRMLGNKQQQTGSGDPGQPLTERERRTLEKRIAQLEDETKVVEQLRADNQRLKEENGALIRVISKLSK